MNKLLLLMVSLCSGMVWGAELDSLNKISDTNLKKEVLEISVFRVTKDVSVNLPKIKYGNIVCISYVSQIKKENNEIKVNVENYCDEAVESKVHALLNIQEVTYFPKNLEAIEIVENDIGFYQKIIKK